MRILHVSEVIKGGICSYLREIIALQRQTFGEDCIAAVIPATQSDDLPTPPGVTLTTFDDIGSRIVNALRLARRTWEVMAAFDPDVLHIHSTFAGAVLRPLLAARGCRARIIYCPHGWAFERELPAWMARSVGLLEYVWSRWCDYIVCVSEHERSAAMRVGINSAKLVLIRNGIPKHAPKFPPIAVEWPDGCTRLLFVGRFDRQKGVDILFDALRGLEGEAFAIIAGDSLRGGVGTLPRNARNVGWLTPPQLEAHYRSADAIVMPSRWEGFGLVALEAMRASVPVIASRVGGLVEIVVDGETGTLLDPVNKESLAKAIRALKMLPLRTMGNAGYQRFVECFTIDAAHETLCKLYHKADQCPSLALNDSATQ